MLRSFDTSNEASTPACFHYSCITSVCMIITLAATYIYIYVLSESLHDMHACMYFKTTKYHIFIIPITFMNCCLQKAISDERDDFQQVILKVLYQEVIPEFNILQDLECNTRTTSQTFRDIMKCSIDYLCKSHNWLQALTAKQTFCWGLVASSSSRVHVTAENFEWLHNYSYVISELGKLFNTYCTRKKLSENQSVIVNSLPDDIALSCYDDVTRYVN